MRKYDGSACGDRICPFTLEPFEVCQVAGVSCQKRCPFSLELCVKAHTH